MKIIVLAIGKLKSRAATDIVSGYSKRIAHYLPFEIKSCRDEKQALSLLDPRDFLVVLDERGRQKTSAGISEFIASHQMKGTKRMFFFIGGEDGAGIAIKSRANFILGLSEMTFPHELVRALLLEQIYRALSILRGEPYHRV